MFRVDMQCFPSKETFVIDLKVKNKFNPPSFRIEVIPQINLTDLSFTR